VVSSATIRPRGRPGWRWWAPRRRREWPRWHGRDDHGRVGQVDPCPIPSTDRPSGGATVPARRVEGIAAKSSNVSGPAERLETVTSLGRLARDELGENTTRGVPPAGWSGRRTSSVAGCTGRAGGREPQADGQSQHGKCPEPGCATWNHAGMMTDGRGRWATSPRRRRWPRIGRRRPGGTCSENVPSTLNDPALDPAAAVHRATAPSPIGKLPRRRPAATGYRCPRGAQPTLVSDR